MSDIVFVLGSQDCEMERAHELLVACGQPVHTALVRDQGTGALRRVRPGESATCAGLPNRDGGWTEVPLVGYDVRAIEVAGPWGPPAIDHHGNSERAGWGPERFLPASSLGQVIETLAIIDQFHRNTLPDWEYVKDVYPFGAIRLIDGCWCVGVFDADHGEIRGYRRIPPELVYEAAADHCLGSAFAGACPGIDPTPGGAFWRHVVTTRRAVYAPQMPDEEFAEALNVATATLRAAPDSLLGEGVRDLTALSIDGPIAPNGDQFPSAFPFGPLAAVMSGLGYVVRIRRRDGRLALRGGGCGLGTPAGTAPVEQWLAGAGVEVYGCEGADAPRPNNLYGDPARGLFGGTLREQA